MSKQMERRSKCAKQQPLKPLSSESPSAHRSVIRPLLTSAPPLPSPLSSSTAEQHFQNNGGKEINKRPLFGLWAPQENTKTHKQTLLYITSLVLSRKKETLKKQLGKCWKEGSLCKCVCVRLLTSHSVSDSTNMFVYWVYWQWSHRGRKRMSGAGVECGGALSEQKSQRRIQTISVSDTPCVIACAYLSDGSLANLVRVFPDALQEVPQLRHGCVPDLRPQFGDVFSHDGAEPVLARLRETRLLQLFQCAQGWVVPSKCTGQIHLLSSKLVECAWNVLIAASGVPPFWVTAGNIGKSEKHQKNKQRPRSGSHDWRQTDTHKNKPKLLRQLRYPFGLVGKTTSQTPTLCTLHCISRTKTCSPEKQSLLADLPLLSEGPGTRGTEWK